MLYSLTEKCQICTLQRFRICSEGVGALQTFAWVGQLVCKVLVRLMFSAALVQVRELICPWLWSWLSPMLLPYCASTVTLKDPFPEAVVTLAQLLTVTTGVPISAMWRGLFFLSNELSPLRTGLTPLAYFMQAIKCCGIFILLSCY